MMPVGSTILTGILATDKDASNWKITYEIVNDTEYAVSNASGLENIK